MSEFPRIRLVTDAELENPVFLTDVKTFAANLRVAHRRFLDWLADGFRDAQAELVDSAGNKVDVDLEELERDNIEFWFRDWCRRPAPNAQIRLRAESRERVRLVATLLRLIFPKESILWGVPMAGLAVADRGLIRPPAFLPGD